METEKNIESCIGKVKEVLTGGNLDFILDPVGNLNHGKTFSYQNKEYLGVLKEYCRCENHITNRIYSYCNCGEIIKECIKDYNKINDQI